MATTETHRQHSNWISLIGAVLTTASGILFLTFFFLDLLGFHSNPYLGIVTFLLLPAGFVLGLLLIPFGLWRTRRRLARGEAATFWPTIDLGAARIRHVAIGVLALTGVNIAVVALAANAPGCFRCHDDAHKSSAGVTISQDCELCHRMP